MVVFTLELPNNQHISFMTAIAICLIYSTSALFVPFKWSNSSVISTLCLGFRVAYSFLKKFWRTQVLIVGPLIPLFWTSDDVSSGFRSQSGQPYLYSEVYMFPEIHFWYNTSWPLGGQHGSWAILFYVPVSRHWWVFKQGSIIPLLPHSVRPGRCSTDWAMPAQPGVANSYNVKVINSMLSTTCSSLTILIISPCSSWERISVKMLPSNICLP